MCGVWSGHTAFVHHVGYAAHYDADANHSSWPLPATADCAELARFAHALGIARREPRQGDILLLWSERGSRFVSSSIVIGARRRVREGQACFDCTTVEGRVDTEGSSSAPGVNVVRRCLSMSGGHCFVRWADLDGMDRSTHRASDIEVCIGRMVCAA